MVGIPDFDAVHRVLGGEPPGSTIDNGEEQQRSNGML